MKYDKEQRVRILNKFNGHCAYCGVELKRFQIDHKIPRSRFHLYAKHLEYKLHDEVNLVASCQSCNSSKNDKTLEQWRVHLTERVAQVRRYDNNFRTAERFGLVKEIIKPVIFYFEVN